MDIRDDIRARIDFPALVGQKVDLPRSPNGHRAVMARCPFHDDSSPSLAVYTDHAHCFGACGQSWDCFGWIMQRDSVDFPEALRECARLAGVALPEWTPEQKQREQRRQATVNVLTEVMRYYQQRLIQRRHSDNSAMRYALSRGWSTRTILRMGSLGYAPDDLPGLLKHLGNQGITPEAALHAGLLGKSSTGSLYPRFRERLIFPFVRAGRCYFLTGRDLTGRDDVPKWFHLPVADGDHRPLYGSAGGSGPLVVVESPADALSLWQMGRDAVAVLGTTLPDGVCAALSKHRPLWMLLDRDPAGIKGIDRLGQALGPRARVAMLPEMDVNAHLQSNGPEHTINLVNDVLSTAPTYVEYLARTYRNAGVETHDQALDLLLASIAQMGARDLALMRKSLIDLSGIQTSTFNELLKNHLASQQAQQEYQPSLDGRYVIVNGAICRSGANGPQVLADFSAHIERELKLDDGENITTEYQVVGSTSSGQRLPVARVPAAKFSELTWLDEHWGVNAVVAAGKKNDVSTAIKLFSKGAILEHIYTHTGWRTVGDQRVYLHCGGGLGYQGHNSIQVDLGNEMSRYELPTTVKDPVDAFRTSMEILEVADPMVSLPIWAAMFQAPLGAILPNRMVLWVYGPTNTFKSSLVLLAMCHFGNFSSEGDAVGWTSTGNAMELAAYIAKDAPLILDDFAHQPNPYQQKRLQQAAERIIRSAGNESGRMRLNKLTKFQTTTRIRSLIIATGETLPSVAPSAHARILPLRFTESTVNVDMLSQAQEQSERYRHAMAGYLLWIRDHWDDLVISIPDDFRLHREEIREQTHGFTARLTDAICRNYTALQTALRYGQECGAVAEKTANNILGDAWKNLIKLSEIQDQEVRAEDPVKRFCALLEEMIQSGRVWLCPLDLVGGNPTQPLNSEKIGWEDSQHYWLLYDTTFGLIQRHASQTGYPFTFSMRETQERLHESGILVKEDPKRWKCRLQRVSNRPYCVKLLIENFYSELG